MRNRIALCLLLVYVSVLGTIELNHTDQLPILSGTPTAQALFDQQGKTLTTNSGGLCFACLFAQGQFSEIGAPAPFLVVEYILTYISVPFSSSQFLFTQSARAPPPAVS